MACFPVQRLSFSRPILTSAPIGYSKPFGSRRMEFFTALFGKLLVFVYHCFDRIVIQGYLPLLVREEHMVHFFRDVQELYPIPKPVLAKRRNEGRRWVEAFAREQ